MMQIYNTQTRRKEEFKPIEPGKVRIYCCGPTVYNYFHIGNARPFIVFDTLRRYLEHKGYEVKYVQNFTDIDDKMIRRANEEGITVKELGDRFIKEYYTDADALGIERATIISSCCKTRMKARWAKRSRRCLKRSTRRAKALTRRWTTI